MRDARAACLFDVDSIDVGEAPPAHLVFDLAYTPEEPEPSIALSGMIDEENDGEQ